MIPFLMGVLDRLADRDEQLQSLRRGELGLVAILGDRHAVDQLHDEVRSAGVGRPGVQDPGDVRVIHQRQGLPLGLEPGDHLVGSMPGLMIFDATFRRTGCSCSAM